MGRNKMLNIKNKNRKYILLDGVIVVLVVCFLFLAGSAISELYSAYSIYRYDEDSFAWNLEYGHYADMVSQYHVNVSIGKENDAKLQEYYGVAKYYQAAVDYKLYLEAGEEELAQDRKKKMDEAYLQMGDFDFISKDIHEKLGL